MAIDNIIAGEDITPEWGNAVADQLNDLPLKIQSGAYNATFTAGVSGTLTFPEAFGAAPIIVATIQGTQLWYVSAYNTDATSTQFLAQRNNGDVAGTRIVHWVAIGVPA